MANASVPPGFTQELRQASAEGQAAKLILLRLESEGTLWHSAAAALVEQALRNIPPKRTWQRVVLFTGHRVDGANRKSPRFPATQEQVARAAIRQAMKDQQTGTHGSVLGISGGANGGDLLFLEVCEELGIPNEIGLALPTDEYVKASVESEDPSWVRRFAIQMAKHANVPVLAESSGLPDWLAFKQNYDIWQRTNLWLLSQALSHNAKHRTLLALWDGETGDGPGGTEHMVSLAKTSQMQFVWLKTKELFGLATQRVSP